MKWLLPVLLIAAATMAIADGTILPDTQMMGLQEAPPRISSQRAVIKWDGSEETMLVESTIAGPAGRYGWVVPLPHEPSFVKAVKPEYIEGTFAQAKPPVIGLPTPSLFLLLIGAGLSAALFLTAGHRYRKYDPAARLLAFCFEAAGIGFLYFLGTTGGVPMPSGSTEDRAAGAVNEMAKSVRGLEIRSYGTIGAYEVNVLRGKTGKPVLDWLREHHISVPKKALSAIEAYARDGWVCMAAELRKDTVGPLPPHPLKAVFPAEKPVYPMRLTGTQEGPLQLEMLVVANERAEIAELESWSCKNDQLLVYVPREERLDETLYSEWDGTRYAMAKNGAIVTYLRGELSPEQMQRDYEIEMDGYTRFEATVHERGQAIEHAAALGLQWFPAVALIAGFLGVLHPMRAMRIAPIGGLAGLVIGITIGIGWYMSVKKVDTSEPIRQGLVSQPYIK